ncbi:hypothetical protein EV200_11250 [Pedobacter psychrotolerans]|uniref:Uncharacterized protein n=1 Tax=Pedobacter psychrotolerans TaxID=1843235 RepID=A0A4R2H404_9SPHI|nr:hypothetical protein EV200_11250 [Pedobacter psychrotolerans]
MIGYEVYYFFGQTLKHTIVVIVFPNHLTT